MTAVAILDLKQKLSKLSVRERREMTAYLLRLKHQSAKGRKETSQRMREMDQGKKVRLADLRKKLGHA